jgi:hypothetical protein
LLRDPASYSFPGRHLLPRPRSNSSSSPLSRRLVHLPRFVRQRPDDELGAPPPPARAAAVTQRRARSSAIPGSCGGGGGPMASSELRRARRPPPSPTATSFPGLLLRHAGANYRAAMRDAKRTTAGALSPLRDRTLCIFVFFADAPRQLAGDSLIDCF